MSQENALILQNETDKVVARIDDLKKQYLTKKEAVATERFSELFCDFAGSIFGFSHSELKKITKGELRALEEMIYKKRKIWKIIVILLEILAIPLLGLGILMLREDFQGEGPNTSLSYHCTRKRLIKARGKDFFPYEAVKNYLERRGN